MQALTTARLVLDAPREADIRAVFTACQDPEILRWIPLPDPYTTADAEFFVRSYAPHGVASGRFTVWAIRTSAAEPLVGAIEVRSDEAVGSASLGCWLTPAARGNGFMREALTEVCRYALDPQGLGFTQLRWESLRGNETSLRLARAIGFDFAEGNHRTVDFRGEQRAADVGVLAARSQDRPGYD